MYEMNSDAPMQELVDRWIARPRTGTELMLFQVGAELIRKGGLAIMERKLGLTQGEQAHPGK